MGRAITLYEQILIDRVRVLGEDHPATLASRSNLAFAYESAGEVGRAIPLYEQTLSDSERALGKNHPLPGTARSSLASAIAERNGESGQP